MNLNLPKDLTVEFNVPVTKVIGILSVGVIGALITLMGWTVSNTHLMTNSMVEVQTNQTIVISKLTELADFSDSLKKSIGSLREQVNVNYTTQTTKLDNPSCAASSTSK